MRYELKLRGLDYKRQHFVPVHYKDICLSEPLKLDVIVEDKVIVDLKAKEQLSKLDKPKLLAYLRLRKLHLGLIINFHVELLKDGVFRVANDLAGPQ